MPPQVTEPPAHPLVASQARTEGAGQYRWWTGGGGGEADQHRRGTGGGRGEAD
jgi:hypothetical protein